MEEFEQVKHIYEQFAQKHFCMTVKYFLYNQKQILRGLVHITAYFKQNILTLQ